MSVATIQFQFPYCTWEFNTAYAIQMMLNMAKFQFPYCTWEFKVQVADVAAQMAVSIPILHVGVQNGNKYTVGLYNEVSIPILHVGVQT